MRNKNKAPRPIRRYSDIVKQNEIIITAILMITYITLLFIVVYTALYL